MRVALLTREFPPNVYGGAGVHVEHLSRELDELVELEVHCYGPRRPRKGESIEVHAHRPWSELDTSARYAPSLEAISVDLAMTALAGPVDVAHSHTWYANFGGHLLSLARSIPHVATVHSLEPLRPWKREQLGGGYDISSFCERTGLEGAAAIIAVSSAVAKDIHACYPTIDMDKVAIIPNGVDTEYFRPMRNDRVLERYGLDPSRPIVSFVGRISRQKGIDHLFRAVDHLDTDVQLVVRAGAPDTVELGKEVRDLVDDARRSGRTVAFIEDDLSRRDLVAIVSSATVACSPSVYEPFGMVNVEAMACEVPVVASAVGGIPEVVDDGVTGLLVPLAPGQDETGSSVDAEKFALDVASALQELIADPVRAQAMGREGRRQAIERFSWHAIATRTVELYESLLS